MARIRTIKPEFFKHSGLFDAEQETGLPLRLAFAGLWTCCDREGRFKWRPRELKLDALPFDECDFSRVLDALATRGFVIKYTSGGEFYGYIQTWRKHQVINNRESPSTIPEPPLNEALDACPTRDARENDATGTPLEGKGKEGKGREGAAPRQARDASLFFLPSWILPQTWSDFEEMRKKLRRPMTDRARRDIIAKLDTLRQRGQDVEGVLAQSIRKGWQDVFEVKDEPPFAASKPHSLAGMTFVNGGAA